jgi:hypothetical protein
VRQLQDTLGNVANQLWVLQVVGSNPAAPTTQQAVIITLLCETIFDRLLANG